MPKELIIISDIHGCYKTLLALIDKAKLVYPNGELVFLGDLVDRGPMSKEVVEYAISNKIQTCLGNHEHMMVDYYKNQRRGERSDYMEDIWLLNGGESTIKSFGYVSDVIIAWMDRLPLCIVPKDYPNLLLSHTGHGGPIIKSVFQAIWERSLDFPKDGYYRVFGHTQSQNPLIRDNYTRIDTGAAHGGKMTAFVWPTKEIIQQDTIDHR